MPCDDAPLVSVITPCFNHGVYLDEWLDCLVSQTEQRWEAIIVDDGSTDPFTTSQLAKLRHPRVTVLTQPNSGPAGARNRALAAARGAFMLPLDMDDALRPQALEIFLEYAARHPEAQVFVSDLQHTGRRNDVYRTPRFNGWRMLRECLIHNVSFVRREVFDSHLYLESMRHGFEDWELWIRSTVGGDAKVVGVPHVLFDYRIHEWSRNVESMESFQVSMAAIAAANPNIFADFDSQLRIKRKWSAFLDVVAPPGMGTRFREALARQTLGDARVRELETPLRDACDYAQLAGCTARCMLIPSDPAMLIRQLECDAALLEKVAVYIARSGVAAVSLTGSHPVDNPRATGVVVDRQQFLSTPCIPASGDPIRHIIRRACGRSGLHRVLECPVPPRNASVAAAATGRRQARPAGSGSPSRLAMAKRSVHEYALQHSDLLVRQLGMDTCRALAAAARHAETALWSGWMAARALRSGIKSFAVDRRDARAQLSTHTSTAAVALLPAEDLIDVRACKDLEFIMLERPLLPVSVGLDSARTMLVVTDAWSAHSPASELLASVLHHAADGELDVVVATMEPDTPVGEMPEVVREVWPLGRLVADTGERVQELLRLAESRSADVLYLMDCGGAIDIAREFRRAATHVRMVCQVATETDAARVEPCSTLIREYVAGSSSVKQTLTERNKISPAYIHEPNTRGGRVAGVWRQRGRALAVVG